LEQGTCKEKDEFLLTEFYKPSKINKSFLNKSRRSKFSWCRQDPELPVRLEIPLQKKNGGRCPPYELVRDAGSVSQEGQQIQGTVQTGTPR
jgi:hypothetical protein